MNAIQHGQRTEPFVSNFVMMIRLRGELGEGTLCQALRRLRHRHPALLPQERGDCFPVQVYLDCQEDEWREQVEEELRQAFPPQGPFARLVLLQRKGKADILATFHHGVCDGFSGVYFVRDLLLALGQEEPLPSLPPPLPFVHLIPERIQNNCWIRKRIQWEALRIRQRSRTLQRKHPLTSSQVHSDEMLSRQKYVLVVRSLEANQTQAILERCHQEGVTVHAAICVAWLRAWRRFSPPSRKRQFSVSSPVSLRHRLPHPPPQSAGMFLTTVVIKQKYRNDFWQMAREFRHRLQRNCREDRLFLQPMTIHFLFTHCPEEERKQCIRYLFDESVTYDFSITNLGRLDLPLQVGHWQVEEFVNIVNSSPYERTVGVNTLGNRMTFVFASRASLLSQAEAGSLMQEAMQELTKAVENTTSR